MQKIAKDQLLPPGICTLCEGAPVEGQEVVDTQRELVTGFPFKLAGRKYVCDACIVALGNTIGLVSSEQADKAAQERDIAQAQLTAVQDHVATFAKQFETDALVAAGNQAPILRAEETQAETVDEPAPAKAPKAKKVADAPAATEE